MSLALQFLACLRAAATAHRPHPIGSQSPGVPLGCPHQALPIPSTQHPGSSLPRCPLNTFPPAVTLRHPQHRCAAKGWDHILLRFLLKNLQSGVHNLCVLSPVEMPVPRRFHLLFLRTASPRPHPGLAGCMRAGTFSAFSPGSSSPTAEVLNQEQFCPTGDTQQCLGTFVVVTTKRGSWHGVGRDQRCCSTRYHAQDDSAPENNPALRSRATVKKPCLARTKLGAAVFLRKSLLNEGTLDHQPCRCKPAQIYLFKTFLRFEIKYT